MQLQGYLVLFLCVMFGGMESSTTLKPDSELSIEETVIDLRQKLKAMEIRLSSLEKSGTTELDVASKDELTREVKEVEQRAKEREGEILMKVTEMEVRCMASTTEVLGKLQNAENRFLKVDNHLLIEMQQVQKQSYVVSQAVNSARQEISDTLNSEKMKTENLQTEVKETRDMLSSFLASHQAAADVIRENISSSAQKLRAYVDDRLTRLESIQSNMTAKMRTFENALLKYEKDCANCSVSKLNVVQQNRDRTDLQTNEYELLSHGTPTDEDFAELLPTTATVRRFSERCAGEPPSLRNGKPLGFEMKSGSTLQYKCDRNYVMSGNSTVRCENGSWEGHPPTCIYFDATFVLESTPLAPDYIICYSDENSKKIELSRALDTGRGASLPESSKYTVLNKSRFNFTIISYDYEDVIGAFQCEINEEHRNMKIVTLIQRSKYIADMISLDPFRVANIGDSVQLSVDTWRKDSLPIKWKHNGVDMPSWDGQLEVEIQNVQATDAGIYECFYEGRRNRSNHALIRLFVRNCKENLFGDNCDQKCPPCYNGGICHDLLGICVCPAGFTGANCEIGCDGRHFGVNCSQECYSVMCAFRQFCNSYGCACAAGFTGFDCREKCQLGWYGANCKQPCHCANGPGSCNRFNGACLGGCSTGWTGQSCQIEVLRSLSTNSQ